MKRWCLLFVLGMSYGNIALADSQTYYTWTDADGIIHITATPPPTPDAQLNNVMEYQPPVPTKSAEQLAFERWQQEREKRLQLLQERNQVPKTQTVKKYYRQTPNNPSSLLEIEKAQCRSMFSDASDANQCIQRIYSSRSIRSNITRWY
ncbi:DUF4124 domain-containing protein [Candidatus Albibeggiatoa sp. nov. NOAA]|uniref:DUF4124 domain-containing protein n=1 Tax=Candidatus Albibeggiatoa sp. nov. NOAA TaxID=3162724 RepID=UPI0033024D45|nr:DUF4124 domain-containing protein [Thiotrichaceae bacterium]